MITRAPYIDTRRNTGPADQVAPRAPRARAQRAMASVKEQTCPRTTVMTPKKGTEPPFRNEYWDNKEPGIYVDVVSGEPLFASVSKYDSGTGWPSFTVPIEPGNIVKRRDFRALGLATEVRSAHGGSHLGHVFHDGPKDAGGLRYCINSAALRFIPVDDLEGEGYGAYRELFED